MEIVKRKEVKIRQSNHMIKGGEQIAKSETKAVPLSEIETKISRYAFGLALEQKVQSSDDWVEFNIREFLGVDKVKSDQYRTISKACKNLSMAQRKPDEGAEHMDTQRWTNIFPEIELIKGSSTIRFQITKSVLEELYTKKGYTGYGYSDIHDLEGKYTVRVFELIKQGVDKYTSRRFKVSWMSEKLGVSYKTFSKLKEKVLTPAIASINEKTNLNVTLVPHKLGRSINEFSLAWNVKEVIDIPFDEGVKVEPEPVQKAIDYPADFKEKLNKLQVRLTEIGLAQDVIKTALERYAKDPSWKIWPEVNNVRMALKDGKDFPNKHTLKKVIVTL